MKVSGPGHSDSANGVPDDAAGVLANLPRTRPQRSSPRRAAARAAAQRPATSAAGTQKPPAKRARTTGAKGAKAAPETAAEPARPARRTPAAKPAARPARSAPKRVPAPDPVPRQGWETEGERAYGPVAPPGGGEVLATAAEAVIELARAGISGGERLVRDLLSRLPGA